MATPVTVHQAGSGNSVLSRMIVTPNPVRMVQPAGMVWTCLPAYAHQVGQMKFVEQVLAYPLVTLLIED